MIEIPLYNGSPNAHQVIGAQLGDYYVELTLDYKNSGQWSVDMAVEGVTIVSGAMLEPNCDIVEAWRINDIYGRFIFVGDDTTLDNLGLNNHLIWMAPNE